MPSRSRSRGRKRFRTRGSSASRNRRRGRSMSRSRNRNTRANGYASTTRWGRPYGLGFRGRRTSARRWRSIIFRDTMALPHYRALGSSKPPTTGSVIGTPNVTAVFLLPALQTDQTIFTPVHPTGKAFWEPGQVQDIDFGTAAPLFAGDVTLRGGIARLSIGAYPENVGLRVHVWAVWANANPDIDIYAAVNNTNRSIEWDPSLVPDFTTKFGKILYQKQAMVPIGENFEIVHRFKPQKIDQARFRGQGSPNFEPAGSQLWWMLSMAPLDSNAVSAAITTVTSYNLSFSADAVDPRPDDPVVAELDSVVDNNIAIGVA